jgi:cytochrome c-type biogenesis protein
MLGSVLADVAAGLSEWWAPALAFVAGAVSFASPCVLPLVPGYVSFVTAGRLTESGRARLAPMLLFVAGFTIVFTLYGAFASSLVSVFKGAVGQRIAGAIVILMGVLLIAYALQRGSIRLYEERRPFLSKVRPGTAGAMPLGMAFAAGWTPCIGPVLGGILAIASQQSAVAGGMLLILYSLGLGVPFLLIGLGVQRLVGALEWVQRHYKAIAFASGGILVTVGVLLVTGLFTRLFAPLQRFLPAL